MGKTVQKIMCLFSLLIMMFPPIQKKDVIVHAKDVIVQDMETGIYHIPVHLWHATNDEASVGNNAMKQSGKLTVEQNETYLYLKFGSMNFAGMNGYLMQLNLLENVVLNQYGYPLTYEKKESEVCSTYSIVDEYNSENSSDPNCAGKKYPKVVRLPVDLDEEYMWIHIYVPIMGSLGFGDQICRIKLDISAITLMSQEEIKEWEIDINSQEEDGDGEGEKVEETEQKKVEKSQLKSIIEGGKKLLKLTEKYTEKSLSNLKTALETAQAIYKSESSTQSAVDSQVTAMKEAIDRLVEKSSEVLDKDKLKDGKYSVNIDIYHAVSDQESMGNPAVNKKALLIVKNNKYTMEISTKPMVLGSVTAYLHSIQVKQTNGTYKSAKITARNNEGDLPSIFQLVLPNKEEFIDIIIDPKVEIMGNKPLDARLKISWDTLTGESDNASVEEDNTPAETQVETEAVDYTDKKTKIRVKAKVGVFPAGVSITCKQLTKGSQYNEAKELLSSDGNQMVIYSITVKTKDGQTVQPNGMTEVSIPVPNGYKSTNLLLHRIDKGSKILLSGKTENDYYVVSTNKLSVFGLVEKVVEQESNTSSKDSSSQAPNNKSKPQSTVKNSSQGVAKEQASITPNTLTSTKKAQKESTQQSENTVLQSSENKLEKYIPYLLIGISICMSFLLSAVVIVTILKL